MRVLIGLLMSGALVVPAQAHDIAGTEVEFFGAIPCTVACAYWVDNGFAPCEAPFPPGSYLDRVTSPAPSQPGKITVLEATLDSEIDWDGFLCRNDETREELSQACSCLPPSCDEPLPGVSPPIGCHEDAATPVVDGQTVIFRAYNWSDAPPAQGEYAFRLI